ncbi:related to Peptidyl-prolyl cis-trans isomerase [Melanopsichium pennsylvanicum]|uniref:Related to Peptidyl-prolyl cis-trans isomerase n=2 Tax=Melanopsichium pennsylvanicum TaxID=63383 RepID=A0AAJ4XR19_9BASI|nr:related to Peptidyl-prolyl cis-trans isomerase [Melanopsichium pennsylvanicum 4]SNX87654.1 related to Peptidyl-prolyl cis-trans isomerase [Melanopsichium pennsylvanicum]
MGHGKSDRPYLSAAEHSGVYGAHSASTGNSRSLQQACFQPVPFDCCAISFQAWSNPVCSADCGIAFELTNLIPYLRKYGTHPVTGQRFELENVVKLKFHKNEKANYFDPISMKEFGAHSSLIAIRQSGNVFLKDTVDRLNMKSKYMKDLVTDQEFTKADIITIHDPQMPERRDPQSMHHVKQGLGLTQAEKGMDSNQSANLAGSAQKLLSNIRRRDNQLQAQSCSPSTSCTDTQDKPLALSDKDSTAYTRNKAMGASTGMAAASFTSSCLTPRTAIQRVLLDDEEIMFAQMKCSTKNKGYVRLTTNFGPLNLELHCDRAPKTCFNFLSLCKAGYYDDTIFHRNIRGFMIQGGDPTATGRGGQSIWGTHFRDEFGEEGAFKHDARGVLSMANKGSGTNGSQFFITYRAVSHLDAKHTVFGRLVDGAKDETLAKLEGVPSEIGTDRPLRKIRILNTLVTENPFDKYELKKGKVDSEEQEKKLERKRRRENDRTTWLGTELGPKQDEPRYSSEDASEVQVSKDTGLFVSSSYGIGKYIDIAPHEKNKLSSTITIGTDDSDQRENKKMKRGVAFGDFSTW